MVDRDWAALFREEFAAPISPVEARIGRAVFGDEYPEEVDPYSYVTRTELRRIADEVHVGAGRTLVDIGCGRGGPGLWVAASTGARLIGIDIADTAVEAAWGRAAGLGLLSRVEYQVGTFEHTLLPDQSADAVMSVDSLIFTPEKVTALKEIARVLRRGGRFVFTSWDYHRQPSGRPPQVDDHRPLLELAGFKVLAYDETERWREYQTRNAELLLESVGEIAAESGESPENLRKGIAEMAATIDTMTRRFLAVAEPL